MNKLLRAELRRLRWTRSLWALPAAAVAISAFAGTVLVTSFKPEEIAGQLSQHGPLRFGISNIGLVVALFGIRLFGDEVHHGTFASGLLRVPDRRAVLFSKLVMSAAVTVATCTAVYALVLPVTLAARNARGLTMSLDLMATAGLFARNLVAMTLVGLAGVALAATVRNRTVALIAYVLWVGFGETILGGLLRAPEFMPGALVQALMSGDAAGGPGVGAAAALLTAGVAALTGAAVVALRSDVD